jgi:AraC-like DNA-binding protein
MTMTKNAQPWPLATNRPDPMLSSAPNALRPEDQAVLPGQTCLGVAEIVPMLREFHIDVDPIIRRAGLDPKTFENGPVSIPFAAFGRLLSLSAASTGRPDFGLLVGARTTLSSLGYVGRLMQHSETVGDALRHLADDMDLLDRGAVPTLTMTGNISLFTYSVHERSTNAEQISETVLAVVVSLIRALSGDEWNPTEVLLPHSLPAKCEPYRQHFRAPVRFNQEVAAIVLPARDLEFKIADADPLLRTMLNAKIKLMKTTLGANLSDEVRRLLRIRLTGEHCTAQETAEKLSMHRRTLSRHLKRSGSGYRTIANEVRFDIARQLLEDTTISLVQVATILGYSEASAFTRAFERWSGQSPSAWRSANYH